MPNNEASTEALGSREATLRGLLARDMLREVGASFTASGIRWVALKGVALHVLGCRDRADRPVEDADVLVDPRRVNEAIGVARTLGFVPTAQDSVTVALERPGAPLPVDLHYRPFEPGLFRLGAEGVLDRAVKHGEIWVPSRLDLYGHLVGHFAKGRLGPGDRTHLRDFAAVAATLELEADRVAEHLRAHGLRRAALYTLGLSADLEDDGFARDVLRALPPDPVGRSLAAMARLAFRTEPSAIVGTAMVSALDDTLLGASGVFVRHGAAGLLKRWGAGLLTRR